MKVFAISIILLASLFFVGCSPFGSDSSTVDPDFDPGAPLSVSVPTGFSAAYSSGPAVDLTWVASVGQGSITYTVSRSITSGSGYAALTACTSISSTSCSDTTVINGTTYFYVVSATNLSETSADSTEVSITPAPPTAPTLSKVSVTSGVSLSWTSATGAAVLTYSVKRGVSTSGPYTTLASGLSTTLYTDATALTGTAYYYVVEAVNAGGAATSNEVVATPMSTLSLTSVFINGSGSVSLAWPVVLGASSYTVKYGTSSGVYPTTVTTTGASPQTISGLTAGTVYYFMVQAINATDSVNASAELGATPLASFSISSSLGGVSSVTLNWGASAGAASYTVKYGTSTGTYGTVFSPSATSPTTVTGLSSGITYYFMVTAANASGSLDASLELSRVPDIISSDCTSLSANTPFAFGAGTSSSPFIICNLAQFRSLANASGSTTPTAATAWASGVHYKLMSDLTLTGLPASGATSVQTIGTTPGFSGQFDGNGYKIVRHQRSLFQDLLSGSVVKNLTLDFSGATSVFFSPLASTCTNSNLSGLNVTDAPLICDSSGVAGLVTTATGCTVDNVSIELLPQTPLSSNPSFGGLFYSSNGSTITNSSTSGHYRANIPSFGGLISVSVSDTIINSSSSLNPDPSGNVIAVVLGGLVGTGTNLTITNSYFNPIDGFMNLNAWYATGSYVGGLVGVMNGGTISGSYAPEFFLNFNYGGSAGSPADNNSVGGLVGRLNSGTILNSYSQVNFGAISTNLGGLVGHMAGGTINKSYYSSSTGLVSDSDGYGGAYEGGLVGYVSGGTIQSSFVTAPIRGGFANGMSGGLVGLMNGGAISNSFIRNSVLDTYGGLVGEINNASITNSFVYSDSQTSSGSIVHTAGAGSTCSGVYYNSTTSTSTHLACATGTPTGLTTAQFANSGNFTGWDFSTIWQMLLSYPTLR